MATTSGGSGLAGLLGTGTKPADGTTTQTTDDQTEKVSDHEIVNQIDPTINNGDTSSAQDNDFSRLTAEQIAARDGSAFTESKQMQLRPVFDVSEQEAEPEYYYRRLDIRNFVMGDFEFENHICKVVGDEANQRFLRLLSRMPELDKNWITNWNPEAFKSLTSPVDLSAVRGIAGTDSFKNDPRQVQGKATVRPLA
jgi:hypothetical protein